MKQLWEVWYTYYIGPYMYYICPILAQKVLDCDMGGEIEGGTTGHSNFLQDQ